MGPRIIEIILISLYLGALFGESSADWTHGCPTDCACKWISGRKTAECRDGGFTSIPVGLSEELQVLDLRGNSITTLRNYVFRDARLLNLNKIKMNSCGIRRVERYAFAELKILIELDLSDNQIEELNMDSFDTNDRLREFQIAGNPLTTLLGTSFPPLQHFQKLSFRNCKLNSIPPWAFHQLIMLEQLDLSGNQLQTLSVKLFENLDKLKTVSLHENPWICDCRLQGFRDWALGKKLLGIQSPKCSQPDNLANFEWSQLMTSNFACPPEILMMTVGGQDSSEGNFVGKLGQTIRLECQMQGNPAADVRWVKDNIGMTNSTATANGKSYFIQISGDTERWVNLTFPKANAGDGGEYTCVGENKAGSAERNITLNFEGVVAGVGSGTGIRTVGGGLHRSNSWIWILIISIAAMITISILLIILICLCFRKNRGQPKEVRKDFKGEEPLMTGRDDSLNKIPKVTQENGFKESFTPLLTPSENYGQLEGDSEYPDLLDLPRRHGAGSPVGSTSSRSPGPRSSPFVPQTLASYYRRPLQLNPSAFYDPAHNGISFYPTQPRRPHSPFSGSVASFASEPPQQRAIVPPPHRPGYVTLPRRPRLNSWAPRDPLGQRSVSPSGSSQTPGYPYVKYDNLGTRRTADGSSRHSLNKIDGEGGSTPGGQYPSSTLPVYPRGRHHNWSQPNSIATPATPHYSFDPIQENSNEGPDYTKNPQENTESSQHGQPSPDPLLPGTAKKVPPKPPPKPKKKSDGSVSPETIPLPQKSDDGTEI